MEGRNETLTNMIPPVEAAWGPAEWIDQNGHTPLGIDGLLFSATIDLSGWTKNDFTFGTVQSQYQDPGVYLSNTASSSQQDFKAIIYGNYRLYVPNSTLGLANYLQLISSGSFGSKEPTASSMLYCYRIIKCVGAPAETISTPACRIGLFGAFYQEGDIPFIMRLKRSYELQQLED